MPNPESPKLELPNDDRWASSVIRDLLGQSRRPDVISLAGGLPADESLPSERVQTAVGSVLTDHGTTGLQYGLTSGEPVLAEIVASRSARPGALPGNILITSGSQQALDLVARAMAIPGSEPVVAIDNPGYLGAVQIFRANGYRLEGIPVDSDGMVVDELEHRLNEGLRPTVLYTNPAFQNPTGACLSPERARKLVDLAEQYHFLVLADDPYIELYLEGPRPTPIPSSPFVAYLGSTSKVIAPGLRIGWLDADESLVGRVTLAKQAADLHTSTLNQLVAAEIMSDDRWWGSHLSALRSNYTDRRLALRAAVAQHLPGVAVSASRGGFFLWLTLDRPTDVRRLMADGLDAGVAFVPGYAFAVGDDTAPTLRLSYSNGDPATYSEAIRRLASVL